MKDFNTYFSITDRSREWKISKYKKVWNNLMKKSDLLKLVEKTRKKIYSFKLHVVHSSFKIIYRAIHKTGLNTFSRIRILQ